MMSSYEYIHSTQHHNYTRATLVIWSEKKTGKLGNTVKTIGRKLGDPAPFPSLR